MNTPSFAKSLLLLPLLAGCPKTGSLEKVQPNRTPVTEIAEDLKVRVQECAPDLELSLWGDSTQAVTKWLGWQEVESIKISNPDPISYPNGMSFQEFTSFCHNNPDCTDFPREVLEDASVRRCIDDAILQAEGAYLTKQQHSYEDPSLCAIRTSFSYAPDCRCIQEAEIIVTCNR